MKIKFLQTVAHGGHIRKFGSTLEVPDKDAAALIEKKLAEKYVEPKVEDPKPGDKDKK
jgi:hypothetical protein